MRTYISRRQLIALLCLLLTLSLLCSGCRFPEHPHPPEPGSTFSIRFLDVGQGDSALIICDGEAMLIDGGEANQSDKLYSILTAEGITRLTCLVATHPHSDHIGGLSGALQVASPVTALSPVTKYDSKTFDSLTKYLSQQGAALTIPQIGDSFSLGSASVTVIGPVHQQWEDINDSSLVSKITYGDTSFLFTGDMEKASEKAILEAGIDPSATVLKVAHHGSDSSTPGQPQAPRP